MRFISYSQNFEDVMLWRALKHIKKGFYIDVGAQDPVNDSVSKAFYERGWRGIHIEPVPEYAALLRKDRPDETVLEIALADVDGEIELNVIPNTGLSNIIDASAQYSQIAPDIHSQRIKVMVLTLKSALASLGKKDVHWLKIDVEGLEERVLKGWDSQILRPWIIVVEATIPNSPEINYVSWDPILIAANYQFVYFDGLNRFYVAKEHLELVAAFNCPPNCFDDFELTTNSQFCRSFSAMLQESEADRAERWRQINSLTTMLNESEADRAKLKQQINPIMKGLSVLFLLRLFKLFTKFVSCSKVEKFTEQFRTLSKKKVLKTIAVDLTPILPGGDNGGAKIFVLELLRRLAKMAPKTQFILLTQAASHDELSAMDAPNMRRYMMAVPVVKNHNRSRFTSFVSRMLSHFPNRLRSVFISVGYRLHILLKRNGSGSLLRAMNVDLLFCPFTAPTYFEMEITTVCTIYDLQYKGYPEFFSTEEASHRERVFIEACRRANILTAISSYSRNSAIAYGGIAPERIRTIYLRMAQRISSGVDSNNGILNRLGLTKRRYLFYPANFWKHKNHEMLFTAFSKACHEGVAEDIKLVCTGAPGERQDWLINVARTMSIGERIIFPGYLPDIEFSVVMLNCKGMIFPSLYEGFGLPVIEAMAAGVPVACSNTTSLPEVAADAAILFDPRVPTQIAQALTSLVEDEGLCDRLIQSGRKRAMEFSDTERMAREYWELFQLALASEKRENLLVGVYSDGWAGRKLSMQVTPFSSAQTLEIDFFAPEWLPQSMFKVQAIRGGTPQGESFEVIRGTKAHWLMPIDQIGGYYEIEITPTFVPAHLGLGEDQRELSVMLQRCGIVRTGGEYIDLFPVKVAV